MKILALYLPQFHETPSNNEWWGKGYTEWDAVKNAKKTNRIQRLPRIPLDNRYYDLSDSTAETWKWQADLAREYKIYGFVIYHYWFAGRKELDKPAEILLQHKEIDIHYSFCWDCSSWSRTWYENNQEILIEQNYGDEVIWRKHFEDLLPYFKDERYIKNNNRPLLHVCRANGIKCLPQMRAVWDEMAKEHGFNGIFLVSQNEGQKKTYEDALYNFEPTGIMSRVKGWYALYINLLGGLNKHTNKYKHYVHNTRNSKRALRYIEKQKIYHNIYAGTFCGYDDSPRRQKKGLIFSTVNPGDFQRNLEILLFKSKEANNEYLYINAWNEWGECAYLEPDSEFKYAYLDAVKNAYKNYIKNEA